MITGRELARHYRAQAPRRPRRPIRIQVSIPLAMSERLDEVHKATGVPVSEIAFRLLEAGADSLMDLPSPTPRIVEEPRP